jgi:formylglycine-generating enzyme required for sulfatase activity
VQEWTNSLYRDYPYDAADGREMVDPSIDAERVFRGSCWKSESALESSSRWRTRPDRANQITGFRVIVYDIEEAGIEEG